MSRVFHTWHAWYAWRAWLGRAFVLAIATLLGWNVYVAQRNQTLFTVDDTLHVSSGNIATVAALNPMEVISRNFATYYRLRELAGKTLVIPAAFTNQRFFWERVSRLHVEQVPELRQLSAEAAARLDSQVNRYWAIDAGTPLSVIIDRDADRYVLIGPNTSGYYTILPEPLYRRELSSGSATQ